MTLSFPGETKEVRKNLRQPSLGEEEGKSVVESEPSTEEQSWLGPYLVMKALPTFEDLAFRKLRCPVLLDRPLMVWIEPSYTTRTSVSCSCVFLDLTLKLYKAQEELDECIKIRREVRRRIQKAQKVKKKKFRWQLVRKKRREQHERNTLSRRARGLLSHKVLRRLVGQREDADSIWLFTEKILGFSDRKKQTAQLASKTGNYPYPKADEEEDWEDSNSNSDEQNEGEDSDHSAGCNSPEKAEYKECEVMEYDDASGEVAATPSKWGTWFNAVRKDDEEDEFLDEF